jgi:hypothetical protein
MTYNNRITTLLGRIPDSAHNSGSGVHACYADICMGGMVRRD